MSFVKHETENGRIYVVGASIESYLNNLSWALSYSMSYLDNDMEKLRRGIFSVLLYDLYSDVLDFKIPAGTCFQYSSIIGLPLFASCGAFSNVFYKLPLVGRFIEKELIKNIIYAINHEELHQTFYNIDELIDDGSDERLISDLLKIQP